MDCPTEEDCIITAAGPAPPPQESQAPARVVRQPTPFKCSRTRKAMETSMEDRDCNSGSSDNSETVRAVRIPKAQNHLNLKILKSLTEVIDK